MLDHNVSVGNFWREVEEAKETINVFFRGKHPRLVESLVLLRHDQQVSDMIFTKPFESSAKAGDSTFITSAYAIVDNAAVRDISVLPFDLDKQVSIASFTSAVTQDKGFACLWANRSRLGENLSSPCR